jgi:hypothetical protein
MDLEYERLKMIQEYLTTKEAALLLRRSERTLQNWSTTGKGPMRPIRLNGRGHLLWRRTDVDAILCTSEPSEIPYQTIIDLSSPDVRVRGKGVLS